VIGIVLARVEVPDDPPYVLTLDDLHHWHSDDAPEVASALTTLHANSWGEWNGAPGAWQAHDAARLLKGEVAYLAG
jgi:hypothetical protein